MAKSFTTLRTAVVRIVLYAAVERAVMLFAGAAGRVRQLAGSGDLLLCDRPALLTALGTL
jgi:hypothetical protein